jgi:nicotinamidase-related amidase
VTTSPAALDRTFFSLSRTFIPPVTLDREQLALVIVDMQYLDASPDEGFGAAMEVIEPGSMDFFNHRLEDQVVPSIARLVSGFRERQLPIVYVLVGSDYRDLRDLPRRHREWIRTIERASGIEDILWSGNPAYRVREEFPPRPEDTIVKKTALGAFTSSTLDETLRSMGI